MVYLLIGFSGSGKTSIGSLLASKLKFKFIEMDLEILENTGFESINKVYSYKSSLWAETEIETSKYLSIKTNLVISSTAGIVDNNINIQYFKENTKHLKIIYLETDLNILHQRICKKFENKSFEAEKFYKSLIKIYEIRDYLYKNIADLIINTSKKSAEDSVKEVLLNN